MPSPVWFLIIPILFIILYYLSKEFKGDDEGE